MKLVLATIFLCILAALAAGQSGTVNAVPYLGKKADDTAAGTCDASKKGKLYQVISTGLYRVCNGTSWADLGGGSGTVTHTGGSLTSNAVVLGAGSADTKTVAGILSDGTSKVTLGVAGTSVGSIDFKNATSGTVNLAPTTGALGTSNIVLPASSGTVALTNGNVATATALAADPADCSANNFATAINASGTLTCAQPSISTSVSGLGTGVATSLGIANNSAGGYSPIDGTATLSNKTLTAPVINGATSSGSTSLDFSGNSGTFKTSTGANTLSGAVTVNDATTPSVTTAAGKTNTGFLQVNGKTSGALKLTAADAAAQTATVSLAAQTTGTTTLTIPDQAGTSRNFVFDTLSQTLTNKTINGASNTLTARIANDVSGLGTGIATALAVNTGSAGAPVLFNGAGGTPSSLTLTNATGLPVSGITASTSTALGVGSVELGAASDTTLSRAAAGSLAVEGVTVSTSSNTLTLTNKTITNPAVTTQALTDQATVAWDASLGNIATLTITASRTMGGPTNLKTGGSYVLALTQGGAGSFLITWNSVFKWPGAIAPTLTTTAGAKDLITCVSVDGTNLLCNALLDVR
jgi:hypothetical protein